MKIFSLTALKPNQCFDFKLFPTVKELVRATEDFISEKRCFEKDFIA